MKIAMLVAHSDEYRRLADITIYRNKVEYCRRRGYEIHIDRKVCPEYSNGNSHASGFTWSRLKTMRDLVASAKYDWVYCVGCDTLITNFYFPLECVIEVCEKPHMPNTELPLPHGAPGPVVRTWNPIKYKPDGRTHVIFPSDRASRVQADSFLVRSTTIGEAYLNDILDYYGTYSTHPWVEQQAMIDLRFKHAAITHIVPQFWLNSYDYALICHLGSEYMDGLDCYGERGQWHPGDFLVHWPGQTLKTRMEQARRFERLVMK